MMELREELAIIEGVGFGNRDVGHPVLFFCAMISEGCGALQVLEGQRALAFIKTYEVYDVKDMEGKPVWVQIRDSGTIEVTRAWGEKREVE